MVKPTQKSSCGKNAVSRNLSNSGMARKKDTSTIVVILTGDTRRFAEAIARKLGIDWVRAKLAREGKVSAIADLQAKAGRSLWWAMGSTTLRARPGRRRNGDRRRRAALRGLLVLLDTHRGRRVYFTECRGVEQSGSSLGS